MRLAGKKAVVVGAGQKPGEMIGNGRATAELFAREGAEVLVVDRDVEAAEATAATIAAAGGTAVVHRADITDEQQCRSIVQAAVEVLGRIDVLHNNVGIGLPDASLTQIAEEDLDLLLAVNLKGLILTCKHAFPVMRAQGSGSVINISSTAAVVGHAGVAYKVSKAAINAYTQSAAMGNARYGVRVNCIMPGMMNTPMAVDGNMVVQPALSREQVIARRDAEVPLLGKQGTGWDTAYAALFLASDESSFVTGVCLPVDGGAAARVG